MLCPRNTTKGERTLDFNKKTIVWFCWRSSAKMWIKPFLFALTVWTPTSFSTNGRLSGSSLPLDRWCFLGRNRKCVRRVTNSSLNFRYWAEAALNVWGRGDGPDLLNVVIVPDTCELWSRGVNHFDDFGIPLSYFQSLAYLPLILWLPPAIGFF